MRSRRSWTSKFIARSAPAILAAIASRDDAELQAEVRANAAQPMPDKLLVKSLQDRVRQHAAALGIEPEILATKRDLVGVALGDPPAAPAHRLARAQNWPRSSRAMRASRYVARGVAHIGTPGTAVNTSL